MAIILMSSLALLSVVATAEPPQQEALAPIFDGKTLSGWIGAKESFHVDDGMLVCRQQSHGNLFSAREYSDFVLQFEFQLTPGANNGLAIRSPLKGDPAYVGIELQILDNTAKKYQKLEPYQYHGSAYGIAPARRGFLKPLGQWNIQEVHCQGRQITVHLNGTRILDVDLERAAPLGKTVDGREHPGWQRQKGHIGFLSHGDRVLFRNIRIRELRCVQHPTAAKK